MCIHRALVAPCSPRIWNCKACHPGDARALYFGANALSQLGQREKSMEWVERALELEGEEPQVLYNVACVYALLARRIRPWTVSRSLSPTAGGNASGWNTIPTWPRCVTIPVFGH